MIPCATMQPEVADHLVNSSAAADADGDLRQHDDGMHYGDGSEADVDEDNMDIQMSRLSIESSDSDAGTGLSNGKKKKAYYDEDDDTISLDLNRDRSLPGTPAWGSPRRRAEWLKEYASETEARAPGLRAQKKRAGGGGGSGERSSCSYYWPRRSSRRARESRLRRAWEMRRCHRTGDGTDSHSGGSSPCVVVRPRGRGAACMCMDMDEVRACRDLGLELPCDWTVEIPPGVFHAAAPAADTSSGGDSPVGSWRVSSPGNDPRDIKARLRVWAQAVALASASRLGR